MLRVNRVNEFPDTSVNHNYFGLVLYELYRGLAMERDPETTILSKVQAIPQREILWSLVIRRWKWARELVGELRLWKVNKARFASQTWRNRR